MRFLLVLLIMTAGCMRNIEPASRAPACDGTPYVVVANDWTRPVEVYAYAYASVSPMRIGTVLPNSRDEFALPKRGTAALRTHDSAGRPISLSVPAGAVPVEMAYLCRQESSADGSFGTGSGAGPR